MPQTRIYVPLNLTTLANLSRTRELAGPVVAAHAVTSAFERSLPGTDEEEREYAAMCAAAQAASDLRVAAHDRRIVAAADVPPTDVADPVVPHPDSLSLVDVAGPVRLRHIVSFHVDEIGGTEEVDMLWFDVTELDDVITFAKS